MDVDRIESRCAGVLAQGGRDINSLDARDVLALVQAYRRLEQLRAAVPDALLAWEGHDRAKTREFIESVAANDS